jgi:hypothetical protein
MHCASQCLLFRALFWASQCARLNTWPRRVPVLLVVLLVAFVGGLARGQDALPPGQPSIEQTIKGDTAAWAEVDAALKKLESLSGYRERFSVVGAFGERTEVRTEVIPRNSKHTTSESTPYTFNGIEVPAGASESVDVKGQIRLRTKTDTEQWGPWRCFKARPPADMRGVSFQITIEASRGPDTVIEGTQVRTYVYTIVSTLTSPDQEPHTTMGKTTLYVETQTGLPRRSVDVISVHLGSDDKEVTTTKDFYDYDAKIEISLPSCEEEI